jgi:hypothetical protein
MECRDLWPDNAWAAQGLLLYFGPWTESYGASPLLDLTPNSHWADDSMDAPLLPGRTFTDAAAGLHITPLYRSATVPSFMDVMVEFDPAPHNRDPDLSLSVLSDELEAGQETTLQAWGDDSDGDPVYYSWELGDGTIAGNTNLVLKSWSEPGEYLVRCRISDGHGGASLRHHVIRVGNPASLRLSGRVTLGGAPVAGARISLRHDHATYTDADGYYVAVGLTHGTYQLHPGKAYHVFEPMDRVVELHEGERTDLDFTAAMTDTPNNPPYVVPQSDAVLVGDESACLLLSTWAYDDGLVKQVYFLSSTNLAAMGRADAYAETWTNLWADVPWGDHVLTVLAVDEFGVVGEGVPVRIQVMDQAPSITSWDRTAAGMFRLEITGRPGQVLEVETSSNLKDWVLVERLTNDTGRVHWSDSVLAPAPRRFFRVKGLD